MMLALMASALLVGLALQGGFMDVIRGQAEWLNLENERRLERLSVTLDGGRLKVSNVGTIPVTLVYLHTPSSDSEVGTTLLPGGSWYGPPTVDGEVQYVVTGRGNVFGPADDTSSSTEEPFPASAFLFYSPQTPSDFYVMNPAYGSTVGVVTKMDLDGSTVWVALYLPEMSGSPSSYSTSFLPSCDPNYSLFFTTFYNGTNCIIASPYRLQAPLSQIVAYTSSQAFRVKASTRGFLLLDTRYQFPSSNRDYFWTVFRPLKPDGYLLPAYDPGPFPSRSYERFYGSTVEVSNGTHLIEVGFGTEYNYAVYGSFPYGSSYPYSSVFIRVHNWQPTGLSQVAYYNVSGSYPPFPYLAEPSVAWEGAGVVYGNRLLLRAAFRNSTNHYILLDAYDLDGGRLIARRVLWDEPYSGSLTISRSFKFGFLDSDSVLLQDDVRGLVQVLRISSNFSVSATATAGSIQTYRKLGGAYPLSMADYTSVTDYYIFPGSGWAYASYAGVFFYDSSISITGAVWFDGLQPQPKSSAPLIVAADRTIMVLVTDRSGNSILRAFKP